MIMSSYFQNWLHHSYTILIVKEINDKKCEIDADTISILMISSY